MISKAYNEIEPASILNGRCCNADNVSQVMKLKAINKYM